MLSIIIPSYNEYACLLRLISYLHRINTGLPVEVIIALSTFNTDETPSLEFCKIVHTPYHNRGAQMNYGAAMAKGDIFMFLHADVIPPESYYEDICLAVDQGFLFGFFSYSFHPTSPLLKINSFFTKHKGIFAGGGDQIHFMNRELYVKMGGYDENWAIMEDFEFVRRFKAFHGKYTIVKNYAVVSSRKYSEKSWFRVNLANFVAFSLFLCNVDSVTIRKVYHRMLYGCFYKTSNHKDSSFPGSP